MTPSMHDRISSGEVQSWQASQAATTNVMLQGLGYHPYLIITSQRGDSVRSAKKNGEGENLNIFFVWITQRICHIVA